MRLRLLRIEMRYASGMVLHTAKSGAVPHLAELRLLAERSGEVVALGASRTNINYLTGQTQDALEAEILSACIALDWGVRWDRIAAQVDSRLSAISAPARMLFEMAAVDGAAREAGMPLHQWLGSGLPEIRSTPTNQTLFWTDEATMLARAGAYAARGFLDLKLRIGIAHFAEDLRRLELLRGMLPPAATLSVDANGTWSAANVGPRIKSLTPFRLAYLEQPLPAEDWTALTALPIMLDESLAGPADIARLIETRVAPLAHLKLAKLGGLDRLCAAARGLAEAGIGVMVGQMNEGAVSTLAAAHAAIALAAPWRELYGADGLANEPARPVLRYVDGALQVPSGPGLGLSVHPSHGELIWEKSV